MFIILRPRPRTYFESTSPLLLLQLHQQQQLLSINIINSTNHHLQHAKLRILLQRLTSPAAYERSGGPPKRPAAKRPCIYILNEYVMTQNNITAVLLHRVGTPEVEIQHSAACARTLVHVSGTYYIILYVLCNNKQQQQQQCDSCWLCLPLLALPLYLSLIHI